LEATARDTFMAAQSPDRSTDLGVLLFAWHCFIF
jgi:hypothetical protein